MSEFTDLLPRRSNLLSDHIAKPMVVKGETVTMQEIAKIILAIADAPLRFKTSDLIRHAPGDYHQASELLNRLLQRWRKLGLCGFKAGRWALYNGSWSVMQSAASRAQTPSTASAEGE